MRKSETQLGCTALLGNGLETFNTRFFSLNLVEITL